MPFENPPSPGEPDVFNPYKPSATDYENSGTFAAGEPIDEETLRTCLGRERALRRLSWLNVTLAALWIPVVLAVIVIAFVLILAVIGFDFRHTVPGLHDMPLNLAWPFVALAVFHVGCFTLNVALAIGLRRLQPWARWTEVGLAGLFLVLCVFSTAVDAVTHGPRLRKLMIQIPGTILSAGIICLLLSPRTRLVFSKHYRQTVADTGKIRR